MKTICLITLIVFQAISLGITIAKHGQPKDTKHNTWTFMIALTINWLLLWGIGVLN